VLLVLGGLPIDTGSAPASSNMLTAAVSSVFLRANAPAGMFDKSNTKRRLRFDNQRRSI
jgi:hypothetical protein